MYVRRVIHKERFHYTNGSAFNSTSTAELVSSGAAWTVTYDAVLGGYITSPAAGVQRYLTNYDAMSMPTSQVMFDAHVKATAWNATAQNGTEGFGILFLADDVPGSMTEAYRLRNDPTVMYLERLNGTVWSGVGTLNVNSTLNTDYYYRLYYAMTDYYVESLPISNFQAGYLHIYRGTSYDNMAYVGKIIDNGTYLTAGSYFGLYKGSGSTVVSNSMGCFTVWDTQVADVDVKHEMDSNSYCTFTRPRNSDELSLSYLISERVEVWVPEANISTGADLVRLYFDGKIVMNPSISSDVYSAEGFVSELENLHWQNGTVQNGTVSGTLRSILAGNGGKRAIPTNGSLTNTYVLHGLNLNSSSDEGDRLIQGKTAVVTFKQMCTELNYSFFHFPDGRFLVSDTLLDSGQAFNATSRFERIEDIEVWYDGKQIVSVVNNYHNGWSTPVSNSSASIVSTYGPRTRTVVDMLQQGATQAGRVNSVILNNYGCNPEIVKISYGLQHFDILPMMKVNLTLAGIGGAISNWDDGTPSNWTNQAFTVQSTHYDSRTGLHEIIYVLNDQNATDSPVSRSYPPGFKPQYQVEHLASMDT